MENHEVKRENVPYVECKVIQLEFLIKDPLPNELTQRIDTCFRVCDQFFHRFYLLRDQSKEYLEVFNGYRDAKRLDENEKIISYKERLNQVIEDYQLTLEDFRHHLEENLSEQDLLLFHGSISRGYHQFNYDIKNKKGLGYFKQSFNLNNFWLNLEKFDLYDCTCTFQGFEQPIPILIKDQDSQLFEANRGSCFTFTNTRCIGQKLIRPQFAIVSQDGKFPLNDTRFKRRNLPIDLMEDNRIK